MEGILENRLYNAAAEGNTESLQELLQEDTFLVDRVSFTSPNKSTPLHVATMNGHEAVVQEILIRNPRLAQQLDSQQSSPLHIASAQGYVPTVEMLLLAAPHMCMSRDYQGRNPLHLAAMKGHVEILKALVEKYPSAAREKVDGGQTVLHLCVKHGQLEALKILAPKLNDRIGAKDADGDTILHMAVAVGQTEIIRYLVKDTNINLKATNRNGQTAMDILEDSQLGATKNEIETILRSRHRNSKIPTQRVMEQRITKGNTVMVVAVLIATVAFQAGVSPAGGIWQEDSTQQDNLHRAGEAVMASTHPEAYKNLLRANTIAFVSSGITILLIISDLPIRRRRFMGILMIIMWLAVTSLTMSFAISISVVTPKTIEKLFMPGVLEVDMGVCFAVIGILVVGSIVEWLVKWSKKKVITWWPRRARNTDEVRNQHNASNENV